MTTYTIEMQDFAGVFSTIEVSSTPDTEVEVTTEIGALLRSGLRKMTVTVKEDKNDGACL